MKVRNTLRMRAGTTPIKSGLEKDGLRRSVVGRSMQQIRFSAWPDHCMIGELLMASLMWVSEQR